MAENGQNKGMMAEAGETVKKAAQAFKVSPLPLIPPFCTPESGCVDESQS